MPRPLTRSRRPGAATVEFAVTLPVLLTLLLGVWEYGRLIQLQQVLNNAAREGGRQASTGKYAPKDISDTVNSYITNAGFKVTDVNNANNVAVRFYLKGVAQNMTSTTIPTIARQDTIRIDLDYPFDNAKWIAIKNFVSGSRTLSAHSNWQGLADVPITIPTTIPAGPSS